MSRTDDVLAARAAADEWAAARGLPASGGYSGSWYINGYLGGWWPADWLYWMADYSIPPELFPARPVHQFSSTPIDQDAMLESEVITTAPPAPSPEPAPEDPCAALEAAHDALVTTVADVCDRIGDFLLAEANATKHPMRRWYVRQLVQEMVNERVQSIGPRPT